MYGLEISFVFLSLIGTLLGATLGLEGVIPKSSTRNLMRVSTLNPQLNAGCLLDQDLGCGFWAWLRVVSALSVVLDGSLHKVAGLGFRNQG